MKILISVFIASILLCTGCSKNPVTGKNEFSLISTPQEIVMGEESYFQMQQMQGGAYVADPEVQDYVAKVGKSLAKVCDRPDLPFEFIVLNESTPNAWALPGGKIAINRGLLVELESESELAAVLAHEIVHSAARHSAKGIERELFFQTGLIGLHQILKDYKYEELALGSAAITAGLINLKYSRGAELEADHYGIKYMAAAGYDPQAAVRLQEAFLRLFKEKKSNWLFGLFATHPPSEERKQENEKTAALYSTGKIAKEEYQSAMKGLKNNKEAYQKLDQGYEALREGDFQKALSLADEAIELEPKEAHFYCLKGKAQKKLRLIENAQDSFQKAIDRNDEYFDFYLQKGLLEFRQGDFSHARKDLEESLCLFPTSPAHYALAEMDLREGRYFSAKEHYLLAEKS